MSCDDLVPFPTDVNAGHLWGAVRVDGGEMNEPPRGHRRPGGLVESDETLSHGRLHSARLWTIPEHVPHPAGNNTPLPANEGSGVSVSQTVVVTWGETSAWLPPMPS